MKHFLRVLVVSAFALSTAGSFATAQQATRTIFGIDISGSSTFLVDQTSANAAGAFVEKYVGDLEAPHELVMVSIGDAGLARRTIDVRAKITKNRASSARKLAPQFGGYFRGLPGMAQRGEIAPQDTTSLIDFFRSLEPVCAAGNAMVIVFSDGVEWSSAINGRALAEGKVKLPKTDSAFLRGCSITLLGVGQLKANLNSTGLAERLIPQWQAFLKAAGAEPVTVDGNGFSF